ncbi:MAG: hypothetical protein PHW04_10845 [Candidatus Wallbacteria bacterium]|nr:hypothetical protein [Candidatus Wallbacteria bacterium]
MHSADQNKLFQKVLFVFRTAALALYLLYFVLFLSLMLLLRKCFFLIGFGLPFDVLSLFLIPAGAAVLLGAFFSKNLYRETGKKLEEKFNAGGMLLNAFDFIEKKGKNKYSFSEYLMDREIQKGWELLSHLPYWKALNPWKFLLPLLACFLILAGVNHFPEKRQSNDSFTVSPGDAAIAEGDRVELKLRFDWARSREVMLFYRQGEILNEIVPQRQGNSYLYILAPERSLQYWFEFSGGKTREYRITLIPKLKLIEIKQVRSYPEYTGKIPETLTTPSLNSKILRGGSVAYRIQLSAIASAEVSAGDFSEKVQAADKIEFSLAPFSTVEIKLLAENSISKLLLTGELEVRPDLAPVIEIYSPPNGSLLVPGEDLKLKAQFHDDYGLKRLSFKAGADEFLQTEELSLSGTAFYYDRIIKLPAELFSRPGILKIGLTVSDNNPAGLPVTCELTVGFGDREMNLQNLSSFEVGLMQEAGNLQSRIKGSLDALAKWEESAKFSPELGFEQQKELQQIAGDLKKVRDDIKNFVNRLDRESEKSDQMLEIPEEIRQKGEQVRDLLKELLGDYLNPLIEKVENQSKSASFDRKKDFSAKSVLDQLDKTLKLLQDLKREKNLEVLKEQLRDSLKRIDTAGTSEISAEIEKIEQNLSRENAYPDDFKPELDELSAELKNVKNTLESGESTEESRAAFKKAVSDFLDSCEKKKKQKEETRKSDLKQRTNQLLLEAGLFWYESGNFKDYISFSREAVSYLEWFKRISDGLSYLSQQSFLFPQTIFIDLIEIENAFKKIVKAESDPVFRFQRQKMNQKLLSLIDDLLKFQEYLKNNPGSMLDELKQKMGEIMKNQQQAMQMLKQLGEGEPEYEKLWQQVLKQQSAIRGAFSELAGSPVSQELMRQMEQIDMMLLEIERKMQEKSPRQDVINKQESTFQNMLKLDEALKKLDETEKKRRAEAELQNLRQTDGQALPREEQLKKYYIRDENMDLPEFYRKIWENYQRELESREKPVRW